MKTLSHGHFWSAVPFHVHWAGMKTGISSFLKTSWVLLLLIILGAMSLVTAVLVSWPAVAHIAAKFFM